MGLTTGCGLVAMLASGCTQVLGIGDFATGDAIDASPIDTQTHDASLLDATPVDCSEPLPRPAAEPGTASLCGMIRDVGTDEQLVAPQPTRLDCDAGGQASDPCSLTLEVYDALAYVSDPSEALPLEVDDLHWDDCGRYVASNIPRTSLGFFVVVVDEVDGQPDLRRTTGSATVAPSAAALTLDVYSITRSLDASWSAQVGFTAGNSFVDRGTILAIFAHAGTPTPGVTMTRQDVVVSTDDFYVTGADRDVISSLGPTGPTGSALMINSSLVEHSGTGAEASGCSWEDRLAVAPEAFLMVLPFGQVETGSSTPCPP